MRRDIKIKEAVTSSVNLVRHDEQRQNIYQDKLN
jgi:hypothetical protein